MTYQIKNQMKKTTIYILIALLAITTSCKEEADQKKVPKEEKEILSLIRVMNQKQHL